MRVCLDCFPFLVRSAGVKAYLFQLHRSLCATAGAHTVSAFPFLDDAASLTHEGSILGALGTAWRFGLVLFANTMSNPVLDVLGTDLLGRRFDLFHASNQVRNPPRNMKLSTTVHDMTAWSHPELHTAATVKNDKRWADRIVRGAGGVITPSEATRADVIRWLNLPPDRVHAIHHGVADAYFNPAKPAIDAARARFGLVKPYVLFVSTIEPRKNLDRLLDAYGRLAASVRAEYDLVIAGPLGWRSDRTFARLQSRPPGVRTLGYVPEVFLPGLTAGATVFAYPSLYEGFGFPVAQAMAAGTAVLTSNVSSLPEITAGSAELVDPLSTADILGGLERLLLSPRYREKLQQLATERARHFRWDRCARETWQFFEQV